MFNPYFLPNLTFLSETQKVFCVIKALVTIHSHCMEKRCLERSLRLTVPSSLPNNSIVIRWNSMAFVCGEQLFIGPLQSEPSTANLAHIDWHTFIALQSCERGVLCRCHQSFCAFKLALGKLKLAIAPSFFKFIILPVYKHIWPPKTSTVYPCLLVFFLSKFWFCVVHTEVVILVDLAG